MSCQALILLQAAWQELADLVLVLEAAQEQKVAELDLAQKTSTSLDRELVP